MKWTDKPPTEPGWYFHKTIWDHGSVTITVMKVVQDGIDEGWYTADNRELWAGPIPEPEEA